MNRKRRNITLIITVLITLVAAIFIEQSFYNELSNKKISKQAQRYITNQSENIEEHLTLLTETIENGLDLWDLEIPNTYLVYVSSSKKLDFWTTNRISPENIPFSKQLVCHRIDNAWFLYKSKIVNSQRIDVLVNIKNNYLINNDYFENDDADQSELSQYSFSEQPQIGYTTVLGENNHPLFYFAKTELNEHNRRHSLLASVVYLVCYFILLLLLSMWHRDAYINLLSVVTFSVIFILAVRYLNIIPIFSRFSLFSSELYTSTGIFSSIGIMLLGAIFWIVLAYSISKTIRSYKPNVLQSIGITLLLISLYYIYMIRLIDVLHNSNINLQLFRIKHLSQETFWVYGILLLYIGGWIRLVIAVTSTFDRTRKTYLYPVIALICSAPLLDDSPIAILSSTLMVLVTILYTRRSHASQYMLVHLITVSIFLAFSTTLITEKESNERNKRDKRVLIQTLPNPLLQERDYQAEERLIDIWNELQTDATLMNMPMMMFNTTEYYSNYFKTNYFSDYLKEYELQVVICNPESYLHIGGLNSSPNCYDYFAEMLDNEGQRISNTGFYWQRNNNGRVSYFGWLRVAKGTLVETSIFIDLESQILSEGRGYPELLRDKSKNKRGTPENLSFARYYNGKLITSSGEYRYPSSNSWISDSEDRIHETVFDNYSHLIYHMNDDSMVILSEPKAIILYPVYAFIYTFLLFYLSFALVFFLTKKNSIKLKKTMSNDIRLTIYGVLLLSLFMVGTASVFFPISIYTRNQNKNIEEKCESFVSSMSRELAYIDNIHNVGKPALQNFLLSLSNTLYKDINVYDVDGRLYASSRPQFFNYKLQGNIICPRAYHALKHENIMSKMHNETIGNNSYKSNYFVISNAAEEVVAYINIPFFTSQQELKSSLWDYLVLLLNIYLLLIIIVTIFTYFSINTITKPLIVMQKALETIKLGKNEKIIYHREDEIGILVEKYNLMVDELHASADQLAKSEREVAWQSMARQIAHEIKNPLTPMKLSIQHLIRTKSGSAEAFDNYFNKTAKTLIEQIDNLSNIATSFSTFAKISDGVPEYLDVNDRMQNIVTLFEQSGSHISFSPSKEDQFINMDKDHFIQIFNNLIKNALQAIPEENEGRIEVKISQVLNNIEISVKDNGTGIDKETQEKIFQPNFTTKNSGMGLGLAISQKMVNNAGGQIDFVSALGEGTTFTVKIPLS